MRFVLNVTTALDSPRSGLRISRHAADRWRARVDRSVSPQTARRALAQFLADGRPRSTPRHWMKDVKHGPGLRFVYSHRQPGVCVLVRDGVALTVITRSLCRASYRAAVDRRGRLGRRGERHDRAARSRLDEEWAA